MESGGSPGLEELVKKAEKLGGFGLIEESFVKRVANSVVNIV